MILHKPRYCKGAERDGDGFRCRYFGDYVNPPLCGLCDHRGEEYIRDLLDRRERRKNPDRKSKVYETPEQRAQRKKTFKEKLVVAGSKVIGRTFGGERLTDEELSVRVEACRTCEMRRTDRIGDWCGELIALRFGKESRRRRGCGCLLDEKRLYVNFDCPRELWPDLAAERREASNG